MRWTNDSGENRTRSTAVLNGYRLPSTTMPIVVGFHPMDSLRPSSSSSGSRCSSDGITQW